LLTIRDHVRAAHEQERPMDVITLASRKGGAGKSTLTAQLAAQAQVCRRRVLVIDGDPQGSLKLWHSRRADGLKLVTPERGLDRALAFAMIEGFDTVFIDTAPTMWVVVQEAIRVATLVLIPARPGFFDLDAVQETVKTARERGKPYAVVINAAPVRRDDKDTALVTQSRSYFEERQIPVWAGQISQRAGFQSTLAAGASAAEIGPNTAAGAEIAGLWRAVDRSITAINAAQFTPGAAANGDLKVMNENAA
jgi:chromosome partitioning protein